MEDYMEELKTLEEQYYTYLVECKYWHLPILNFSNWVEVFNKQ